MKNLFNTLALVCAVPLVGARAAEAAKPNIVYILCDDLGYGDVKCLGGERSKIPTPNMDKLAAEGMIFTEAHSSSSVCTPTRYGLLTGRYNWRSKLQSGVLLEYAESLIPPQRLTVAGLLKQQGYATACIGKWHLGWHWPRQGEGFDFSKPITEGPTSVGFDYYFGTDVPNYPPYCFIENEHTVGIPTASTSKLQRVKPGLMLPDWSLEAVLPAITDKACGWVTTQAAAGKPFFLYLPLTSPHTPIVPTKEWQGKSGLGNYADYVMETDAMIGRVLEALDKSGVTGNTLVIFTSDNGCSPAADIPGLENQGHYPSELRRGYKAAIFDGGHRIPFIARWPGKIKAGTTSDQLICLTDLMATCADILGAKIPDAAGEDSVSILPALLGTADKPLREAVVHHSLKGEFAIRQGQWKLLFGASSGGRSGPKAEDQLPPIQLYDMAKDVGERSNECAAHPEIVANLTKLMEKYVAEGRSTPGAPQQNDAKIELYKHAKKSGLKK